MFHLFIILYFIAYQCLYFTQKAQNVLIILMCVKNVCHGCFMFFIKSSWQKYKN